MALLNLPALKPGYRWNTRYGKTPDTFLVAIDPANDAYEGDFVTINGETGNQYGSMATSTTGDSAAVRTIYGIVAQGVNQDKKVYVPGYYAGDNEFFRPVATFGGHGSRTPTTAPTLQKFIMPVNGGVAWLMTPYTDDAIVIGSAYGARKVAASQWYIDASIAASVLEVIAFYDPDRDGFEIPMATLKAHPHVWVKAALPGNLD